MPSPLPPAPSRFVGRARERELLAELLRRAGSGEPEVVVIGGEAGVGKTHLTEQAAADAEAAGARVLTGACIPLGQEGGALVPITAALRQLVRQLGKDALLELLPASGAAVTRLLPEFYDPAGPAEPADQGRLFQVLTLLLERLGERQPVLLIVEDLHWADRSTRELLGVLARALGDARVLIVATYRTDDLHRGHPLRPFLAELERIRGVRRIQLDRFSRTETAELVAGVLEGPVPPERLGQIFDRSGGNALYAEELAHAETAGDSGETAGGLSDFLRDLLLSRVQRLSAGGQRAVAVAAVGGERVGHQLLLAAADIGELELLEGLRDAVGGQVLAASGDGYAFRHALLREAVYDDLLPGERLRLHRRYAQVLEEGPELVPPDRAAAEVASHWWHAREPDLALPALVRAAGAAAAVSAWAEQYQLLVRALDLWPEVPEPGLDHLEVLESAVVAARHAGEQQHALALVDRALTEIDGAREPERVAGLLAHRAKLLLNLNRDGALAAAEQAERLAPGTSRTRAMVLDVLSAACEYERRWAQAADVARQAVRIAHELGDPDLETSARTRVGLTLARHDRHDEALAELEAVRALAERRQDLHGLARIHLNRAFVFWEAGRYEQAGAAGRAGARAAAAAGLARTLGSHTAGFLAASLFALGRWDEVEAVIRETLHERPTEVFAIYPHVVGGDLAAARGDLATARKHLARARELSERYGVTQGELLIARLAADLALQDGQVDAARDEVAVVLAPSDYGDRTTTMWEVLTTAMKVEAYARTRARAYLRDGTDPHGGDLLDALQKVAEALPATTPPWHARKAQFLAEVDSLEGPSQAWGEVVQAWEQLAVPYPAAYARLRAAEWVLAAGDRPAAQALLRTAAEQADRLGARPLRHEIDLLARRGNLHLAAEPPPPPESPAERLKLTPREAEVLRLVAGGYSNRKIATSLFISEKTASVHVSRILGKLGAASRGEAAAIAHRLRLFDHDPPG